MPDVKMHRLKRAVIKEEYVAITGDMMEAVILNQMIYWSERVNDFDNFIEEERKRQKQYGQKTSNFPLQCGWIHKSAVELKDELMSSDSPKTILRRLDNLVSKGFLVRRRNPEYAYDHVYQYRVDFCAIVEALASEGYSLEGYRVKLNCEPSEATTDAADEATESVNNASDMQHDIEENEFVHTKGQIDPSNDQNVPLKGQAVPAIPETTTETTTEITSSPSYSPRQWTRERQTEDKTDAELNSIFDAIGIERLDRPELTAPMKAIITDLWYTRRIGKATVSAETVKKALFCLTPEIICGIFDKFDWQEKKGQIIAPAEYIKALILNAPRDAELVRLSRKRVDDGRDDVASYDIDEFVRLSMEMVQRE